MRTIQLKLPLFIRIFTVLTKFAVVLIMLFSIILLFFIGSGVLKPSKSWELITQEESIK